MTDTQPTELVTMTRQEFEAALNVAWQNGRTEGYDDGYGDGESDGSEAAYDEGYQAGLDEA